MSRKSEVGQSQLFLAFLVLLSGITLVIATNSSLTGNFVFRNEDSASTFIEVWANTSIKLDAIDNLIIARLLLDNSSSLAGQEIKFYLNESFFASVITDEGGEAKLSLDLNNSYVLKAVFEGNSSLFLNPCFSEIEVKKVEENLSEENVTIPEVNLSYLTIFTDKEEYSLNETVNVFGELILEGKRGNAHANLTLEFNSFVIFSEEVEIINGSFSYSFAANLEEEGVYTLAIKTLNLTNKTSFYFSLPRINATENLTQLLNINAFVSVENVTRENKTFKLVKIFGNVSFNQSLTFANIFVKVRDSKGEIIFEDRTYDKNFLFSFEFLPKHSGIYKAEIFAETEFGSISKILGFDVLKHLRLKPKIKQEKFNYELGEKIRFEILVVDEDTNELYSNASLRIFVVDPEGNLTEVDFTEDEIEKGKYYVELDTEREFRPGLYKLKVKLNYISPNPGEIEVEEEVEFAVGLISINTKKSIYHPDEIVKITMVVVDEHGYLLPNAKIKLMVTNPNGSTTIFSTEEGSIKKTIQKGVYEAFYNYTQLEGNYTMVAYAQTENFETSITSHFLVKEYYEFDVLRNMPVVIDPWHGYLTSYIHISPLVEIEKFNFTEILPNTFQIIDSGNATVIESNDKKILVWRGLRGEVTVYYTVALPLISPMIYQLGPAQVEYFEENESKVFYEGRPWLLVADPLNVIGMIAYGEGTVTTPRYRTWDGSTWSAEYSANSVGGTIYWVVLRAIPNNVKNPRFEEFILGTQTSGGAVVVQVYNGSSWSTPLTLYSNVGTSSRAFDIAYERVSGDAIVVYSNGSAQPKYRVWNGKSWSSEGTIPQTKTTGAIRWIKLASRPNSDEIACVWLDANADISAMIWNGSAWVGEPPAALETNAAYDTTIGDAEAFDLAYESLSGDLLVVFGSNAALPPGYALKPADTYEWVTGSVGGAFADEGSIISLAAEPNTNRIALTYMSEDFFDAQGAIWDGEEDIWIERVIDIDASASDAWYGYTRLLDIGWVGSLGEAVVVYQDGSSNIDWFNWIEGEYWTVQGDVSGAGTTGIDRTKQIHNFPYADKILLVYSDANSDLGIATYDGGSWVSVNPSPIIEDNLPITQYEPFMFAFKEYMGNILLIYDIIPIYNNQEVSALESGDILQVNVSVRNLNSTSVSGSVTLKIWDPSNNLKYENTVSNLNWNPDEMKLVNFSNINTEGWSAGYYKVEATVSWSTGSDTRTEEQSFKISTIEIFPNFPLGQCLNTNYSMYIKIINTWDSAIQVNITPFEDSVWNFDPDYRYIFVNANSWNETNFNLTTPSTAGNYNLGINVSYTDGIGTQRKKTYSLTFYLPSPIIRVTREAPEGGKDSISLYPRLVVHNYGCSLAKNIEFNETVPPGFIVDAAYALSHGASQVLTLPDSSTRIVWNIDKLAINEFRIFSYRIITPTYSTSSNLGLWSVYYQDLGYNNIFDKEDDLSPIKSDTSEKAYLEFDLKVGEERVVVPNQVYVYNLTVKNVGSGTAYANDWNISVEIKTRLNYNKTWYVDDTCSLVDSGSAVYWNSTTKTLIFSLPYNLPPGAETYFNFSLNCSVEGREINLLVKPIVLEPAEVKVCDYMCYYQDDATSVNISHTFRGKPNPSAKLVWFEVRGGSSTTTCGHSTNWDGGDWGEVRLYNDNNSSYVQVWYWLNGADRSLVARPVIDETPPPEFNPNQFTAPNGRLTLEFRGNRAAGEVLAVNRICYKWGDYKEPKERQSTNLFVKVRSSIPPEMENESVNGVTFGASDGWGTTFNFSVMVRDLNNENIMVKLYIDFGSGYQLVNSTICYSCGNWQKIDFLQSFSCDKIGIAHYKFEAEDPYLLTYETEPHNFTIEKEDVLFEHIHGNNQIANRSGNQILPLTLRVRDENGSYVGPGINITLWISHSGPPYYVYDDGHFLQTNESGYVTFEFNPGCNNPQYVVGPQKWKMQVNETEMCYKPVVSLVYNITIMGELNPTIFAPIGGYTYNWGDLIFHQAKLKDDCENDIAAANVTFNLTTDSKSYEFIPDDVGSGFYQKWWDSSGKAEGWYNVTLKVNKTYYWPNEKTQVNAFYLRTPPLLKVANVNPREGIWGTEFNFSVNVTDEEGNNVTVKLFEKKSGGAWTQVGEAKNCTSCSNTTLIWSRTYSCSDVGTWFFKFEATDDLGNTYETTIAKGDYVGDSDSFLVTKHDVSIEYVSGNESIATPTSPATFILRVYDLNLQTYNLQDSATLAFNVTTDGIGGTYKKVGTATSNSTGHVTYIFIPDESFSEGKQNWKGYVDISEMCYNFNESEVYNVTVQPARYIYLENLSVTPQVGEWGENFTFNVTARTNSPNNITFKLLIGPPIGPWNEVATITENVTNQWKTISFEWDPSCSDIGQKSFKIFADDSSGTTNITSAQAFEVQKDTVLLEYVGGNETETRRGKTSALFVVRAV
ncbi:MAG: hypothetical protein QW472_03390, partial [Candidatus Aenigmatarchaeota archaeon]